MNADELAVRALGRLVCLYLATELCKVASAFDRPQRVLELAGQFEQHVFAPVTAAPGGEPAKAAPPDPGRQMPGDPAADPPEPTTKRKGGRKPAIAAVSKDDNDPSRFLG